MKKLGTIAAVYFLCTASPSFAQDVQTETEEQTAELKALNDLQAEQIRTLELQNRLAAEEKKAVTQLGLPSYDGTRKLEGGAGKAEATVLAVAAFGRAAEVLPTQASIGSTDKLIVLAAGEAIPGTDLETLFRLHGALFNQVKAARDTSFCSSSTPSSPEVESASATLLIGAASALAGMLRSNVTYSAIDAPGADSALFADMVAQTSNGLRPGAPLSLQRGPAATALMTAIDQLAVAVAALRERKIALEAKTEKDRDANDRACLALVSSAITAHDAFSTGWLSPGSEGKPPRAAAALDWLTLLEMASGILIVDAQAGGSAANSSNIGTFFGADPLRLHAQSLIEWRKYTLVRKEGRTEPDGTSNQPRFALATGFQFGAMVCVTNKSTMNGLYTFASEPQEALPAVCRTIVPSANPR